jgi:hypothetical protein
MLLLELVVVGEKEWEECIPTPTAKAQYTGLHNKQRYDSIIMSMERMTTTITTTITTTEQQHRSTCTW